MEYKKQGGKKTTHYDKHNSKNISNQNTVDRLNSLVQKRTEKNVKL